MRIRCENCGAKYSISEDLLKKKVTKFRCKKCQHIMVVRASDPTGEELQTQSTASETASVKDSSPSNAYNESSQAGSPHSGDSHAQLTQSSIEAVPQPSQGSMAGFGGHGGYSNVEDTFQGHYVPPSGQQEEDLFRGAETSQTPHDFGQDVVQNEQMRQNNQALDDEFEQAFQEQEEATQIRKAPSYPEIAPNHQAQALVPLASAAAEAKEVENVDTKVFSINALETLRKERRSAQQQREEEMRSKRAPSGGESRWHTDDSPAPAAAPQEPEWYIVVDEQQVGPLTFADIKNKIKSKELKPDSDIWKEGFSDWKKIRAVPTFLSALNSIGASVGGPAAPPPPPGSSSGLPERPSLAASPVAATSSGDSNAGISLASPPSAGGGLFSLADREMTNITSKGPSAAAALLQEPEPAAGNIPGPTFSAGAQDPFDSPSLTGAFQPTGAFQSTFNSSLTEEKEGSSTVKMVVAISVTILLLFLAGGGILFYYMFNQLKEKQQAQKQQVAQQRNRAPAPAVRTQVQKVALATPKVRGNSVVVPATPVKRAPAVAPVVRRADPPPERRKVEAKPAKRRTRRRRRRRRRRRSRRRRRRSRRSVARYVPPRRRASRSKSNSLAPPPPPPGGDAPPPPPPPGGDAPPLPRIGGSKGGTGLNEGALRGILGSKGSKRSAPPPPPRRRRSNLPRSLRKSQVANVIRNKGFTITNCQESYGSSVKSITVSWIIQRSGRPNRIRVRGASGRFRTCVTRAISRWRFPRFSGDPIDITGVPFTF